jgi:hypothetical protein
MSQPNTCSPGYTFFLDPPDGIIVNPAWTISNDSGGNPSIENIGGAYKVISGAASTGTGILNTLNQTFGGTPTIIEADFSYTIAYTGGGYSVTSRRLIWQILDHFGGGAGTAIEMDSSGWPTVTTSVYLAVRDNFSGIEYSVLLATYVDPIASFPVSHTVTGTVMVKQIAGNNIEVYLNGVLKYTSATGLHALSTLAGLGLGWYAPTDTSIFATMYNISYVGPSGLPNPCLFGPYAPTLVSPTDTEAAVSLTPTLIVTDTNTPPSDSFDFQIATDSGFTNVVYQAMAVPNNNAVPPGTINASSLYYWRSRSKVGVAYSDYASPFSFTTAETAFLDDIIQVDGFNELILNLSGSITGGSINAKGSLNGEMGPIQIASLFSIGAGTKITNGQMASPGMYLINIAALRYVTFVKSGDFSGDVSVSYSLSKNFNRV